MKKKLTSLLLAAAITLSSCFATFAGGYSNIQYKDKYTETSTLEWTEFTENEGTPQAEKAIILTWPAVDNSGKAINQMQNANPLSSDGQLQSTGYPKASNTYPTSGMIIKYNNWDPGTVRKGDKDEKGTHEIIRGLVKEETGYPVTPGADSGTYYFSLDHVADSFATAYAIEYSEDGVNWKTSSTSVDAIKHGPKLNITKSDGSESQLQSWFLVDQFTEKLDIVNDRLESDKEYKIRIKATTDGGTLYPFDPITIKTPKVKPLSPAFPTVEGGGKFSQGGRKGDVYVVTNLTDSISDPQPGSLRYGLTHDRVSGGQTVPRIIVFAVGGTIEIDPAAPKGERKLNVPSNTTILGQTAPGEGITLKGMTLSVSGENIILRYLRSRLGSGYDADGANALGRNIVIDHCSFEWGVDETFSAKELKNSSIQYNIIANGLAMPDKNGVNNDDSQIVSAENEVKHGMGSILNGYQTSYTHNLWAHNGTRNPRFEGGFDDESKNHIDNLLQFSDNVVYDWGHNSTYGGERGNGKVNFTNNYYRPGPNTIEKVINRFFDCDISGGYKSSYYVSNNIMYGDKDVSADNIKGFYESENADFSDSKFDFEAEFEYPDSQSAEEAYQAVLKGVGASYVRDAQDKRLLNEVANGTGSFINDAAEAGGYDTPTVYSALTDTDKDGIPDDWETVHNLDPEKVDSGNIVDDETSAYDGYSWIEVYACDLLGEWGSAALPEASYDIINVTDIKDADGTSVYDSVITKLETGKEYTVTVNGSEKYELLLNDTVLSTDLKFTPKDEGIFNLIIRNPNTESDRKMSALIPVVVCANKDSNYKDFTAKDVGEIKKGAEGIASYDKSSGTLLIAGSGKIGMTSTSESGNDDPDSFFYDYKKVSGDVTIITKTDTLAKVDTFQKAGIMLRGSLEPKSEFYMTAVTYVKAEDFNEAGKKYSSLKAEDGDSVKAKNVRTIYRSADNASVSHGKFIGVPLKRINETPNYGWLKLKKTGSKVESFGSLDGVNWTSLGSFETTLPNEFYVGFAIDAVQDTMEQVRYNAAEFSEISFINKSDSGGSVPVVAEGLGDVDFSGKVTATDAALVFAYVHGLAELSSEALARADVKGNELITENNSDLILKKVQNENFLFPVEE